MSISSFNLTSIPRAPLVTAALLFVLLLLTGCGRNMYVQPKYETYRQSNLFENGSSARPLEEGTVSRKRGAIDASFFTGQTEAGLMTELPFPVTMAVLERGQERYDIYCSPCHNYSGNGRGMIVQMGFPQPTSYHVPRLQQASVGYFFNVMTNGFGRMYSYASRIPAQDRWAIAAYIKALQLSQSASPQLVPEGVKSELSQLSTGVTTE